MKHFRITLTVLALAATASSALAGGTISASPRTVYVLSGQTLGSTTISWSTSPAAPDATIYVNNNASWFTRGASGSKSAPWIQPNKSYTFYLYQGQTRSTALLATVTVQGRYPSGSISASPTTVYVTSGQTRGSTTISWSTTPALANATIYVNNNTSWFTRGASGTKVAPWILPNQSYTFYLYEGTTRSTRLLGLVTVQGRYPTGSLSASPTTVVVPPDQTQGTTRISWSTSPALSQATIYVDGNTSFFTRGASGWKDAPWILPGRTYTFRLYDGLTPSTRLLATRTVTGVAQTGSLNPSTDNCMVTVGSTSCSISVTWTTNPALGAASIFQDLSTKPIRKGASGSFSVTIPGGHEQVYTLRTSSSATSAILDRIVLRADSQYDAAGFANAALTRWRTHYADPLYGTEGTPVTTRPCYWPARNARPGQDIPTLGIPACPDDNPDYPTEYAPPLESLYMSQGNLSQGFWVLDLNVEPYYELCPDGSTMMLGPPALSSPLKTRNDPGLFVFEMGSQVGEAFSRAYMEINLAELGDPSSVRCNPPSVLPLPFLSVGASQDAGNGKPVAWIAEVDDPIVLPDTVEFTARLWAKASPSEHNSQRGGLYFFMAAVAEWPDDQGQMLPRLLFLTLHDDNYPDGDPTAGVNEWDWPVNGSHYAPGADLAFVTTAEYASWGIAEPGADTTDLSTSDGDRTYRVNLRKLFFEASEHGEFRDLPPDQPIRIKTVLWGLETFPTPGRAPDGFIHASVHDVDIVRSGVD